MAKALIAGGGIAGMAAATALARAGWEVDVHERAPELGEVGAGIQLSPNATRVLRWLGVLPAVAETAFAPKAAELREGQTGRPIYQADLDWLADIRWGAPYLHVHRADLLAVLADAARVAGARVHLGSGVARSVAHPESVALHLDDGRVLEADLAIGADGIRSRLRGAVNPDEAPRFSGQVAWRALVPTAALPEGTIAPNATVWAGPGRHLVTYYVRNGALVNLVAVLEQRKWVEEGWSAPGDPDALRAAFAGWHPDVTTLLSAVDDCFLWGLFDRPEQVRWTDGRLALIGDAAHPMLPFMAQGAAQALEDVAVLIRQFAHHADIPAALRAWEDERWSRVTRVLQRARANGRLFHKRTALGRALAQGPVALVSRLAPGVAAGQLDWLYGHDAVEG